MNRSGGAVVPPRRPGSASRPAGATAVRATSIVGVGMMAMNALAYGFTLVAAHVLGPAAFGGVSALLGVLIVANVGALALQATGARRLATADGEDASAALTRDVIRSGWQVASALGALLLAATPLIDAALHIDDWAATAMVGAACVPLTLMGAYAGVAQGQRRWAELALVYVSMGAGRVVAGGVALLVEPTLRAGMIGIAAGSLVPALLGGWYTRVGGVAADGHQPILGELWRNGHTLLAFFAFTNLDVLAARHVFSHHDAGIYAAGAILAKACLFLPTFVLVAAFPTMAASRAGRPWLRPLLAVSALGSAAVLATWLLPDLAVTFAGGAEYAELAPDAWLFALEGTLFAAVQILVYDSIAGQNHSATVLWLASALVAAVALTAVSSVAALATLLIAASAAVGLVTGLVPRTADAD